MYDISDFERIIEYTFRDKNLLRRALTHSSYAVEQGQDLRGWAADGSNGGKDRLQCSGLDGHQNQVGGWAGVFGCDVVQVEGLSI